jgi:hypothetical protein
MRARGIVTLAAVLFVGLLVWRLPCRWLRPLLPATVQCAQPQGTVWNGQCEQLRIDVRELHNVRWQLAPLPLLTGTLAVTASVSDPRLQAQGELRYDIGGSWQLRAATAQLAVPSDLLPGWLPNCSGNLSIDVPTASGLRSQVMALQSTIQMRKLWMHRPEVEWGDYQLSLANGASAGEFNGQLRDLGTALRLSGTLSFNLVRGDYEINGRVAATPRAAAELQHLVEQLGAPDAEGMRPFSVAGTIQASASQSQQDLAQH